MRNDDHRPKLVLRREALRELTSDDLRQVAGAGDYRTLTCGSCGRW